MRRFFLAASVAAIAGCNSIPSNTDAEGRLFRGEATPEQVQAFDEYFEDIEACGQNIHSMMVVQDGKVILERWRGEGKPDEPHALNSVSKTFTSIAVGIAAEEGLLNLDDKIISYFPDDLPDTVSENLAEVRIKDLLSMSCGHHSDSEIAAVTLWKEDESTLDWAKLFLAYPVEHKPGTWFAYNSVGTYMLSAIIQKVSGQRIVEYLQPRFFDKLSIDAPLWKNSPQGICCGGWGLFLKTEDLAKAGLCILQGGKWNGEQVIPADYAEAMHSCQIDNRNLTGDEESDAEILKRAETSDWLQGYGYQMWRCRYNCYRADGAGGQYILIVPDKNAVIAVTAMLGDMQEELDVIFKHILPVL